MKTAKQIVENDGLTEHDQCEGYILKVQDIVDYMEQYAESEVKKLNLHMQQSEQLVNFLLHLNDKKLINNHDFDYEKEAKKYLKMADRKKYFAEYYQKNKELLDERTKLYYKYNKEFKAMENKKYRDKVNPNRKKRV